MKMRKFASIILISMTILLCSSPCFAANDTDVSNNPHVLFLSSYSYEWDSIPKQLSGITDTLSGKANIDYAFMDTKRIPYNVAKQDVYKHISYMNEHEQFDYVIADDDAALEFVLEYRNKLFKDVPIVFEGINSESLAKKATQDSLITGIVESFPLKQTIDIATELQPEATNIVAISDDTISGNGSTAQFMDCKSNFKALNFSTINCSTMTSNELKKKVASYGDDTILLFLMLTSDADGNNYTTTEGIKFITSNANVPVYKADELGIGEGILGGNVISYHDMAASAAKIVLKLSRGGNIAGYPVQRVSNYYCFDKKVMDKYNITKNDIVNAYSGNVKYVNDTKSIFQTHKSVILPMGIIILLLFALVLFGLIYLNAKKKYVEQLSEKDTMLNNVLDNMPGGIMIFRASGNPREYVKTIYFSQGIPKLAGYTYEEYSDLIKRSIFDCGLDAEDIAEFKRTIATDVTKNGPVHMRFHQKHKNGSLLWISMSAEWAYDESNDSSIYYAVFLDITQQEKAIEAENAALEARTSSEAKRDFLSRMSHDIRTPLNAVLGFTSLALNESDIPPGVADYLNKIDSSGKYLIELINDVLDMAKIESGKLQINEESTDVLALLNTLADAFTIQAAEKGVTLKTDFSKATTRWIMLDPLRTKQIYANLLSNAIKFSESDTQIDLIVANEQNDDGSIHVTTTVKDQGCGMSQDFMDRMFMPFEQNAPSDAGTGTGLGLSIVHSLVDMMNGEIHVESAPGEGSTFILEFDRRLSKPPVNTQAADHNPVDLKGVHVLLCEDNDINALITEKILEMIDCTIDRAENGQVGLEMFNKASYGMYDAIIMDINMPVMNGITAAKAIRL